MNERGAYGDRIGERFQIDSPKTLVANLRRNARLAVTRLRCDDATGVKTPMIPREKAYIVVLHLRDLPAHELWLDRRQIGVARCAKDTIVAVDLESQPQWKLESPFDLLHFYLPRAALEEIAEESGGAFLRTLSIAPGAALHDPVVARLGTCLLPELERADQANQLFVDHVGYALAAHIVRSYGGSPTRRSFARGGLAHWQERRAKEYLLANLDGEISLDDLASECALSPSHFSRAFRQSTGQPPYRWLTEKRVERAQDLLRAADLPLAEIALACGFADQSHFTKTFSQIVGVSPGAWRRREAARQWTVASAGPKPPAMAMTASL